MKIFLAFIVAIFFLLPIAGWGQNLNIGQLIGTITTCQGAASADPNIEQFSVSGTALTGNVTIQAPQYFEVSFSSGGPYQASISALPSGGDVNVTVYVRSSATAPAGTNNTAHCDISTPGTVAAQRIVSAIIIDLPTVNTVNPQVIPNGVSTQAVHFTGTGVEFKWTNDNPGIGLPASGTGDIPAFTGVNNGATPITANISVTTSYASYAYFGDSNDQKLVVFDTKTQQEAAPIQVGNGPQSVSVSPDGSRVYVANDLDNNVSEISTVTNTVLGKVPVGNTPYGLVVSPDGTKVYVANVGSTFLSVINAASYTAGNNIPLGFTSDGIAISPDGNFLYVSDGANAGHVAVVSTQTNAITALIPVGSQPYGLAVSPDGSTVYVANANSSTISIIDVATQNVSVLTVGPSPTGVTVNPNGKEVYVSIGGSNIVTIINAATNNVSGTITVQQNPYGVSVTPDGSTLYVVNSGSDEVSVIDVASRTVVLPIPLTRGPFGPFTMGNFVSSGGCPGAAMKFSITIKPGPPPSLYAAGTLSALTTIYGTASPAGKFQVQGTDLTNSILVTPPQGFELSTDNTNYSSTVTIGQSGNIGPDDVYIRLAASTPVGNDYGGGIAISSLNSTPGNLDMPTSTVTPADLTITANDITKNLGAPIPVLGLTYTGFVNGDLPQKLITLPSVTTTATAISALGQYPIIISGGYSPNYNISRVNGVLTIVPVPPPFVAPNAFTPNGDGINDTWNIKDLDKYPNCVVQVYNRYGENVYSSIGYGIPWDGTYRGAALPANTYYYVINLMNGNKAFSGYVTIIK